MRIDAFNHFFPKAYFEKLLASGLPDIGKRATQLPALHDVEHRVGQRAAQAVHVDPALRGGLVEVGGVEDDEVGHVRRLL